MGLIPSPNPTTQAQEAIQAKHREENLKELERIKEELPEHQKADVDRLWELIKEASRN